MVEKRGRGFTSEHASQRDLSSRRRQEILTPDHQRDTLEKIVDGDGELVGPVTVPIPQQQVSALLRGSLLERSEPQVGESFRQVGHLQAQPATWSLVEPAFATTAVVAFAASPADVLGAKMDLRARARADVHMMCITEPLEHGGIGLVPIALAHNRVAALVRDEAEPVEIVEQRCLEMRPAADAVVILDAQQHASTPRASHTPDIDGVHDVTEVQVPCGRRGEPGGKCQIPSPKAQIPTRKC